MTPAATHVLPSLAPDVRRDVLARLDRFVDRSDGPDACHPWTGGSLVRGYGTLWVRSADGVGRNLKAHRLAFEAATGEAPPTVDHTCHDGSTCPSPGLGCPHRRCCNPAHMEAATVAENARRAKVGVYQRVCRRGHPMTPENTYESPDGGRRCRRCAADTAASARQTAKRERDVPTRPRTYRPRNMTLPQLVEWGLEGNTGDGCWAWRTATVPSGSGYAAVNVGGSMVGAHRLVHEVLVGPVPDGHVVDHTCHVPEDCPGGMSCPHRACVNPAHLSAVPHAVNVSPGRSSRVRPEACVRGHEFTPENTRVDGRGVRSCRACALGRDAAARAAAASAVDGRARRGGVCRNGHDTAVVGLTAQGKCRGCTRESNARWRAAQAATAGTVGG